MDKTKKTKKTLLRRIVEIFAVLFASLTTLAIIIFVYINLPAKLPDEKANMGVTFSWRYARDIGLDWKQAYIAMLDDLGAKKIRIPAYWNSIEVEDGKFDFTDLDWQIEEAGKRNAEIILAVGQKVPRWPECYVPEWLLKDDAKRKENLLRSVGETVKRYKDNKTVAVWQIENEPFLEFGVCPELDTDLLDKEIEVARKNDPNTPIMLTDSRELGPWIFAAKRGDYFGTTMYREVVTEKYGYWKYPIGPNFFKLKKALLGLLVGDKHVTVIELQGEPWVAGWTTSFPLEEQFRSMNDVKLRDNIDFARKTGIKDIYVWGVEWWYWLKTTQNHPEVWDVAKELYK